jgi:hypothetical protein
VFLSDRSAPRRAANGVVPVRTIADMFQQLFA